MICGMKWFRVLIHHRLIVKSMWFHAKCTKVRKERKGKQWGEWLKRADIFVNNLWGINFVKSISSMEPKAPSAHFALSLRALRETEYLPLPHNDIISQHQRKPPFSLKNPQTI